MKRVLGLMVAVLLFGSIGDAKAGTITSFTDRSTFTTTVGGSLTVEDFTETSRFPITTGVLNSSTNLPGIGITPGTIKPGVTYSTPIGSGNFFNIDFGGGYDGGFLDGFNPSNRKLDIAFDSNVSAFGFDSGGLGASTINVVIRFSSGPDQAFVLTYPTSPSFFGFQSSLTDITGATIDNDGGFFAFDLDNFTFGGNTASAVPEPATMTMLGFGVAGMLGLGIRRRRAIAA